jgi:hypothetical protein
MDVVLVVGVGARSEHFDGAELQQAACQLSRRATAKHGQELNVKLAAYSRSRARWPHRHGESTAQASRVAIQRARGRSRDVDNLEVELSSISIGGAMKRHGMVGAEGVRHVLEEVRCMRLEASP